MNLSPATMKLLSACESGNLQRIQEAVREGADTTIHAYSGDERSPVLWLCDGGHLECLKWLAANSPVALDFTARHCEAFCWAAEEGHLDVMKWLVFESGQQIDVNAEDSFALRAAAENNHLCVVQWLVEESGQKVDVATDDNYILRQAAQHGFLDLLKYLVEESGQRVDITAEGNAAITEAVTNAHFRIVQWIVEESHDAMCRNPAWIGHEIPRVDVTIGDFDLIRIALFDSATSQEATEIARYLINDTPQAGVIQSNQELMPQMTPFIDPAMTQLRRILNEHQSVDIARLNAQSDDAALQLSAQITELQAQLEQLKKQRKTLLAPFEVQKQALSDRYLMLFQKMKASHVCRKALEAGVVKTGSELETLLTKEDQQCCQPKTTRL